MSEAKKEPKIWRLDMKDGGGTYFVESVTKTAAIHAVMQINVATGKQVADQVSKDPHSIIKAE